VGMGGLERLARSAAVAGILTSAFGAARPAVADTFGGCNADEGCKPDNLSHAWCYGDGFTSTALRDAATYGLTNLDAQTDFTQGRTTSCTATTDVIFIQFSDAAGPRGDYLCLAFNSANECEQARVRLNTALLNDTANRRKTACHEVGHSGGLRHGGDTDCMINGAITTGFQTYDQHHIDHLNSQK